MKEKKGETLSMTKPGSPNAALKFALRTVLEDCSLMCGESDGGWPSVLLHFLHDGRQSMRKTTRLKPYIVLLLIYFMIEAKSQSKSSK